MNNLDKKNIVIIGASGYTGVSLLKILVNHPNINISALVAQNNAGRDISEIYGQFYHFELPKLQTLEEIALPKIDIAFLCLPHGTTQEIAKKLAAEYPNLVIIDLSADFRITSPEIYEKYYGKAHQATELQKQAIYGLSEVNKEKISTANLIACPGCYPTSALLPLIPLLEKQIISTDNIIIDAKSGLTGAGRSLKENLLFCEANENVMAYSINQHRHAPEIAQILTENSNGNTEINPIFTPHLVPQNKGILATIYAEKNNNNNIRTARNSLEEYYSSSPFVHILPDSIYPKTNMVVNSNNCYINIFDAGKHFIIISVIDNLMKGASGQAVQNMNIRYNWPEDLGLQISCSFP